MCICIYIGGLMGYMYIYVYIIYIYIGRLMLQFAAYGQFVLVILTADLED